MNLMQHIELNLSTIIIQFLIYLNDDLAAQRPITKQAGVRERNRKHIYTPTDRGCHVVIAADPQDQ
jgi:hypothetical protein